MSDDAYTPSEYKTNARDLASFMGPLEAEVLNIVLGRGAPMRVREVFEELREKRKIAYTTVMSTMNTLHEKGLLERDIAKGRGGLLYVYRSRYSKSELESSVVKQVIDSLVRNFGELAASYLVDIATARTGSDEKMPKEPEEEEG